MTKRRSRPPNCCSGSDWPAGNITINATLGGEQRRVALARAFSIRPRILFADEPTGNLDAATGARVISIMTELNQEFGTTMVLVTHDADLAAKAHRVIRLADGAVVADSGNGSSGI